ncbi:UDP-N-acetylmuramoylalanine--D-glutamate ligase [Candidatus Kaiserbacteria bacterium RIFCSPHIGHO2_02_FULL_55_20]|uniref:Multifunctional fusion protein n=1 Tax=Candidatus Kaiserbacteria bacterium RIFCSPHIGHO2_02_FULL_55_20 TaxID=1798497 RepID=A0A1F6DWY8_9BACT|nr:MAG: UDP-N-acetylmuramoylalanine--D-glutamate ligase [Candidatus Kaiserbacteria bacterium RIFCSPHIGHO2_01_FULL_55_37]OGG65941.1 MAG: UDP-N-acetylmuramoylalanine--D-glutamate ligase [Candidatus Kaiserbacteria bacterium RIFCSPHIGHO2_02_FULL_55_20]
MSNRATYFSYTSYVFSPKKKEIRFKYEIGFENAKPLTFVEVVKLPRVPDNKTPSTLLDALLSDVHLMLGISYYKLYCPPKIKMNRKLSRIQADFWSTVYRKGLGEFTYRNNLDLSSISFPNAKDVRAQVSDLKVKERALVGIGGGKDSVVAIELLKEEKYPQTGLIVETYTSHDIAKKVCEVAGIDSLTIRRVLDSKVLERLPGAYEGHIPISAVYAFLGLLSATLYGYRYVVVGNEHSSNFGNVEHHGEVVNHQWSKSAEFEGLFQSYVRQHLTPSITYFSIVRPFYEIRIAELFTKYSDYFFHFTGCNRKFKIDATQRPHGMWCAECPKCAFVFLMLAPFVPRDTLVRIFGRNMLDDRSLQPLFGDILGFGDMKPFDCVGTFDEARAALVLARASYTGSAIVLAFLPRIDGPDVLLKKVMETAKAPTIPARFRFCGMKNALILGYGKEGKATEAYLRKAYQQLELKTADEAQNPNYLNQQDGCDIIIKTPGIPKEKVRRHYVTATNIFFSRFPGTIIGITGSKGKSTTASLIYAILKEAGLSVQLAGNIGLPMLEILSGANEKSIAVVELSSYQLDDIEYSPHIAVVTNLFPDHMDYHTSLERYYSAKRNITKFQNSRDVFIYNKNIPELRNWVKNSRAKSVLFAQKLPLKKSEIPLLGEHNLDNVRAAVAVAKQFRIPEKIAARAIKAFKSLPHRLDLVGEFKGIRFYDDAISTTPESTIAALRAVSGIGTIFLGGFDRGYDFTELEKEIRAQKIKNIVLFPETGKRMFAARSGLNILETQNMEEAVRFAYEHTEAGSAAILSCASPSYGLWKNFEEKGDLFADIVRQMSNKA